ncbi:unnamed protein product [Echinostoma caproni]|uniref:Uncharacterized protein n=1 Tax=Echinostoma caproni TaxID=27848 RepID=A0A183AK86_9TREM|nr:unnamed protein product [Echinostoma caproni]
MFGLVHAAHAACGERKNQRSITRECAHISGYGQCKHSGRNAIWFDEALKYGRSEPTDTFDNPVLSATLPAFRLASLSSTQSEILVDEKESESRPRSKTDPGSPTVPGVNSVPFLIDCLEVWELVS